MLPVKTTKTNEELMEESQKGMKTLVLKCIEKLKKTESEIKDTKEEADRLADVIQWMMNACSCGGCEKVYAKIMDTTNDSEF